MRENAITRMWRERKARREIRRLQRLHVLVTERKHQLGAAYVQYVGTLDGAQLVNFYDRQGNLLESIEEAQLWHVL